MDLFTYLMAKNGNNSSVHGDLFSYLLGKGQSQTYTVSGTTIYIPDAKKLVSFMMTKESTQDGEPTPDNPVPVNVVEGYRNLFDKNNANILNAQVSADGILSSGNAKTLYISIEGGKTYTITKIASKRFRVGTTINTPVINATVSNYQRDDTETKITLNTDVSSNYICIYYFLNGTDTLTEQQILDSIMIVEGSTELPYVPYGNNYIAVNVSDGTNTNSVPLPLNENEIVGIGNYLDEYIVDKSGHCWLNKLMGKVVLDGTENYSVVSRSGYSFYLFQAGTTKFTNYNRTSGKTLLSNYFKGGTNSAGTVSVFQQGNNICCFRYNSGDTLNSLYITNDIDNVEDFKSMLSQVQPIMYYVLAEPQLIDLQTTVDLKLFKGANTITNSEDGYMTIQYR